ncbi:biopolymer transporter ExbD [bacterium]|nr:biopolymer transporter ExbD [bacterium]
MKLEMTLPERPGFLHAVPILNIFALVQLFFLLGPSLVWQSGVAVDLPPSRFQLERFETPLVVTLGPGEPTPRIHFARDSVTLAELSERLEKLRADGAQAKAIVLLQTDAGTPVGVEREVTERVLAKGFRLALVGKNASAATLSSPPSK